MDGLGWGAEMGAIGRFREVRWVAETGSTNADAVDAALTHRLEDPHAFVIVAEAQSAGRGRRDRSWHMPSGAGILASFYVPWKDRSSAQLVAMSVGIALVETIRAFGIEVGLKWPNDLVTVDDSHPDRKLAGMLSEMVNDPEATGIGLPESLGVVVGCGLNVEWPRSDAVEPIDDEVPCNATCLAELSQQSIDRVELFVDLVRRVDEELGHLESTNSQSTVQRYRERCRTIGQPVRVECAGASAVTGTATDIDRHGRLVLDQEGRQRTFDVGDVVHVRASE